MNIAVASFFAIDLHVDNCMTYCDNQYIFVITSAYNCGQCLQFSSFFLCPCSLDHKHHVWLLFRCSFSIVLFICYLKSCLCLPWEFCCLPNSYYLCLLWEFLPNALCTQTTVCAVCSYCPVHLTMHLATAIVNYSTGCTYTCACYCQWGCI